METMETGGGKIRGGQAYVDVFGELSLKAQGCIQNTEKWSWKVNETLAQAFEWESIKSSLLCLFFS